MNHFRPRFALVLGCVWMLVTNEAGGQARGAAPSVPRQRSSAELKVPDRVARAQKVAELDAWLRRLVGQYKIKGNAQTLVDLIGPRGLTTRGIEGTASCVSVGTGAGVLCVVSATWASILQRTTGGGSIPAWADYYNTLYPATILFGIDSEAQGVHYLLVDDHSIADGGLGMLDGDTVRFQNYRKACGKSAAHCPRSMEIAVRPGSNVVRLEMKWSDFSTSFALILTRESSTRVETPRSN